MYSIQMCVGDKYIELNHDMTESFIKNVYESCELGLKSKEPILPSVFVIIEDVKNSPIMLDLSDAQLLLGKIKGKINTFKDDRLVELFDRTLNLLNKLTQEKKEFTDKTTKYPYILMDERADRYFRYFDRVSVAVKKKRVSVQEVEGQYVILTQNPFNWYMIYHRYDPNPFVDIDLSRLSRHNEDYLVKVLVAVNDQIEVKTYTLKPDPDDYPQGIILEKISRKNFLNPDTDKQKFKSIEDFIDSKIESGEFKLPLKADYDPNEDIQQELKYLARSRDFTYSRNLTFLQGLKLISSCEIGAFLVRDKAIDRRAKVVVFKDKDNEVKEITLEPASGIRGGYQCEGKWYPSIHAYIQFNQDRFTYKFTLSIDQFERGLAVEDNPYTSNIASPSSLERKNNTYLESFATGSNPTDLIVKALAEHDLASAKWLLLKGCDLESIEKTVLESKDPEQIKIFTWLKKYNEKPIATPHTLNHYALDVGYGYKTANLMVQKVSLEELNTQLKSSQAVVPEFLPFSDFEMHHHLKPILPELESLWNEFLATFKKVKSSNPEQLETLMITSEGQHLISQIQQKIQAYFVEHPFLTPEIDEWLENLNAEFLIIRSTGKEDTAENPNPGGNETIHNVKKDAFAVSHAIFQVISSYFGAKSISQRLLVGDTSLFTEKPFLPVLLMKMVTEKVNGEDDINKIPRSGVMLTKQNGKADAVTLLQVGLGHNEGVVESKVAVDTYYIDKHHKIASVITNKNTRFVPVQHSEEKPVHLEVIHNRNSTLEKSQALPDGVIRDMKRIADYFAEKYGKEGTPAALDLEYTIQLQGDKELPQINLLQIRPLVEKQASIPNYLDLQQLNKLPKADMSPVKTLLPGDSTVQTIQKVSDIMYADSLTQGLMRYLFGDKGEKSSDLPKVIISMQTAPLTSHEALFFAKRGVVVYVIKNKNQLRAIKKILAQATQKHPAYCDPQRGLIISSKHVKNQTKLLAEGYISYPIPTELSLPKGLFTPRSGGITPHEFEIKIGLLNTRYQKLDRELRDDKPYMFDKGLRELFDIVASSNKDEEAKLALATLLKLMNADLLTRLKNNTTGQESVLLLLQIFDASTALCVNQLVPALVFPPGTPNRLYPLKFLEALLFQHAQPSIVNCESWTIVNSMNLAETKVRKLTEKEDLAIQNSGNAWENQMLLMARSAINSEVRKKWISFIQDLAAHGSQEEQKLVTNLVIENVNLGLSSMWLNFIFFPLMESNPQENAITLLNQLNGIQEKDREILHRLKHQMNQLQVSKSQISAWSDPAYVRKNILPLRRLFLNEFGYYDAKTDSALKKNYQQSESLGRLALFEFMRQGIDVYDRTVKTVELSNQYGPEIQQQLEDVADLLVGYLHMLEGVCSLLSDKENVSLVERNWLRNTQEYIECLRHGRLSWGGQRLVDVETYDYVSPIHTFFREGLEGILWALKNKMPQSESLLQARKTFNVIPLTFGSGVDFTYGLTHPETLEEIFTTIHQNLELIRRFLFNKQFSVEKLLEGDAQEFNTLIKDLFSKPSKYLRITRKQEISHFSIEGSFLEYVYQISLRQHACTLALEYDTTQPEKGITMEVAAFGREEHHRFAQIASYGAFLGNLGPITLSQGVTPIVQYKDPNGASFKLHFPNTLDSEQKKHWISTLDYIFREMSMDHSVNATNLILHMEKHFLPNSQWEIVDEEFYGQVPYLSTALMNRFYELDKPALLYKACRGTFDALLAYDLDDYVGLFNLKNTKGGPEELDPKKLQGFYLDPKYEYVPNNQPSEHQKGGALLCATLFLIQGLEHHYEEVEPIVKELITDPQIAAKFPETVVALEKALLLRS